VSRVLIADDHAVVRAGFKQFLEADPTINAVGEAASRIGTWSFSTSTCPIEAVSIFCGTFKPAIRACACSL
jgi:DNA-binding NarL/FixJ family response regulator